MLPGLFARDSEWAGVSVLLAFVLVPLLLLWRVDRGLANLFGRRP